MRKNTARCKKRFRKTPKWLFRRLSNKNILTMGESAILRKIDVRGVDELMRRGRLKPISNNRPYRFEASIVKGFVRQKPGPKPKPKPEVLKRFVVKPKSTAKGGE